jgi:glutathione S-transferase
LIISRPFLCSRDEVHELGLSDLEALSNWLGNKPYLMGSAPCQLDCTAFGFLATLFYNFPEDYYFRCRFCDRFRTKFYRQSIFG